MTKPIAATPLRTKQKIGVMIWRSMMGLFSYFTRSARRALGDTVSEHAYGAHPAERIEFMNSLDGSSGRAPLVYIHGGGWICGKMEMYTAELVFLAEKGYPVFNLEYPLAPERPHPHMLLSLLSALSWIRQEHPDYESVHLMGDSAGGNLALMLGILLANPDLVSELDPEFSTPLPRVQSIVSIYGVLDRLSWIEQGFPSAALMLECYGGVEALEDEVGPGQAVTPMDLDFSHLPRLSSSPAQRTNWQNPHDCARKTWIAVLMPSNTKSTREKPMGSSIGALDRPARNFEAISSSFFQNNKSGTST